MKREDYISWDEYFMGVAKLAAMRSKDPNTQVGTCIVSQGFSRDASHAGSSGSGFESFFDGCHNYFMTFGERFFLVNPNIFDI